jgi:hypothetical protein
VWGNAQDESVLREGVPLYLYMSYGGASGYLWRGDTWCTALSCVHATARGRSGQEAPVGERPALGSGWPLTEPPRHRLRMVGSGIDMDHCSVVFCPVWNVLVAVSLILLHKSVFGKCLLVKILHVFVFVTCKIIISKYMWNLVNSKCICD